MTTTKQMSLYLHDIAVAEELYRTVKDREGMSPGAMYRKGHLDGLIQGAKQMGISASAIGNARWQGGAKADDLIAADEPMPGMQSSLPGPEKPAEPTIRTEPLPGMRTDLGLRSEPTPVEQAAEQNPEE